MSNEEVLKITDDQLASLSNEQLLALKTRLKMMSTVFNNRQMAAKINLNSAYGVMGNEYFRWYDKNQAEAVTLSGQVSLKWIGHAFNDYLNKFFKTKGVDYVIYQDTDSCYITLEKLVDSIKAKKPDVTDDQLTDMIDKFCEGNLQPVIDAAYADLAKMVNAYDQKMFMKRESIADAGIFIKKKRYALHVRDNEGVRYATPKLKVMGLELVRSTTPTMCKEAMKTCMKLIFEEGQDSVIKFIADFKKKFIAAPLEDIARISAVHDLDSSGKSIPMHVRASRLYNEKIKEYKIDGNYPAVKNGDKIKYLNLKTPNRLRSDVIGFIKEIPPEFGINSAIVDFDELFDVTFLNPIKTVTDAIKWKTEETNTFESLFSFE